MSINRFYLLLKFWHFCDNTIGDVTDRLRKLRDICAAILARFQKVYTPSKALSVDEAMVLWRGRLVFRQYIPGKKHKFGIKLYLLCEPSGYVLNCLVYCGKNDVFSGMGHSESVVMTLMQNYLYRSHELYTDNFYTSIPLAEALLNCKTHLCGTLRRNRKHLPEAVLSAKLERGQTVTRLSGQILITKWQDKREVLMLSTFHSAQTKQAPKLNRRKEPVMKPESVLSYNIGMGEWIDATS